MTGDELVNFVTQLFINLKDLIGILPSNEDEYAQIMKKISQSVVQQGDNSINNSVIKNSTFDNRQYYSDSPDVLRAEIDKLDRIIEEKEARIKEKDAQIKEKDAQIKTLLEILKK